MFRTGDRVRIVLSGNYYSGRAGKVADWNDLGCYVELDNPPTAQKKVWCQHVYLEAEPNRKIVPLPLPG